MSHCRLGKTLDCANTKTDLHHWGSRCWQVHASKGIEARPPEQLSSCERASQTGLYVLCPLHDYGNMSSYVQCNGHAMKSARTGQLISEKFQVCQSPTVATFLVALYAHTHACMPEVARRRLAYDCSSLLCVHKIAGHEVSHMQAQDHTWSKCWASHSAASNALPGSGLVCSCT